MTKAANDCYACNLTLAQYCAGGVPPQLCGLCHLMKPDDLTRYFALWNTRRVADLNEQHEARSA
jgi:hypothetical protein